MSTDTPPEPIPVRGRFLSGEHELVTALLEAISRVESEVRAQTRELSKVMTRMAINEERVLNHGKRVDLIDARLDEHSDVLKASECNDCEERIDALEAKESTRTDREAQSEKAAARQPAWWLLLLLAPITSVIGTALCLWILKGIAFNASGSP